MIQELKYCSNIIFLFKTVNAVINPPVLPLITSHWSPDSLFNKSWQAKYLTCWQDIFWLFKNENLNLPQQTTGILQTPNYIPATWEKPWLF